MLRSHIQTLQSEMHILREELKEKSVLLRSLIITSNNQRNKSSEKTPEYLVPNFPSKENSNYIKEHVPPIKDDVTDFCRDGTATKSDNTGKEKQFEKKISINKKHWRIASLKERSTLLQLRKRVKLLFPSQY